MATPNQEVRIWNVQDRRKSPQYQNRPWVVRWRVGTRRFQVAFRTRDEADHRRSALLLAQRVGESFDQGNGEPLSWQERERLGVHTWARRWIAEQWDGWQPRTRRSALEEMSRFVPLLIQAPATEPPTGQLRRYLQGALAPERRARPGRRDLARPLGLRPRPARPLDPRRSRPPTRHRCEGRDAVGQHCPSLSTHRPILHPTGRRSRPSRPRPLAAPDARGKQPKGQTQGPIEGDRHQEPPRPDNDAKGARRHGQPTAGRRQYQVMTSVMAYGGLRPSEVVMLRPRALDLPASGWGAIEVVESDIDFDEPGDPKTGDRTVPIPAEMVGILGRWLDLVDRTAPEQLIFRTTHESRPSQSNWGRAWHLALAKIGHERLRVYGCRHFAATTWLHAGVPLGETARRLGHSVETLVATYVGALKGDQATANRLIDDYWVAHRHQS